MPCPIRRLVTTCRWLRVCVCVRAATRCPGASWQALVWLNSSSDPASKPQSCRCAGPLWQHQNGLCKFTEAAGLSWTAARCPRQKPQQSRCKSSAAHPGELACSAGAGPRSWPVASGLLGWPLEPDTYAQAAGTGPEARPRSSSARLDSLSCLCRPPLCLARLPHADRYNTPSQLVPSSPLGVYAQPIVAWPQARWAAKPGWKLGLRESANGLRFCVPPCLRTSDCVQGLFHPRKAVAADMPAMENGVHANGHCESSPSSSGRSASSDVPRLQISTIREDRVSTEVPFGGNRTTRSRLHSEPFFIGVAGTLESSEHSSTPLFT